MGRIRAKTVPLSEASTARWGLSISLEVAILQSISEWSQRDLSVGSWSSHLSWLPKYHCISSGQRNIWSRACLCLGVGVLARHEQLLPCSAHPASGAVGASWDEDFIWATVCTSPRLQLFLVNSSLFKLIFLFSATHCGGENHSVTLPCVGSEIIRGLEPNDSFGCPLALMLEKRPFTVLWCSVICL